MKLGRRMLESHELRAPRENYGRLVMPPLDEAPGLIESNAALRHTFACDLQGRTLAELQTLARRELIRAARRYTRAYRDVPARQAHEFVLLAGHQPQLFHPGVWFKNFALGRLAGEVGATAINLLIDNDTVKHAAVRVPGGSVASPVVEEIAFDRPTTDIPFEERRVIDRDMLGRFARRAQDHIGPLVRDPLVWHYWPLVVERAAATGKLGAALAQSRHQLEGAWGLETLELPQSEVCRFTSFFWFAAHLLANLPRLWEIYNQSVAEYRHAHRIRSASHPVPDLALVDDWLEAPFWIWRTDAPQRRPLFVRHNGDQIMLSDRDGIAISLPLSADGDAAPAVEHLTALSAQGIKLRTRALLTTLFARLVLGDLFVHGIGGAKYDELTDVLVERFFGLQPPAFLTISATLHLPIDRPPVAADEPRHVQQQLRQMIYHPERFLADVGGGGSDRVAELVATKRRWIETAPTIENGRRRCHAIRGANEALQPFLERQRRELVERAERAARRLRAESILSWREYAFCLYPEETLRDFLLEIPPPTP